MCFLKLPLNCYSLLEKHTLWLYSAVLCKEPSSTWLLYLCPCLRKTSPNCRNSNWFTSEGEELKQNSLHGVKKKKKKKKGIVSWGWPSSRSQPFNISPYLQNCLLQCVAAEFPKYYHMWYYPYDWLVMIFNFILSQVFRFAGQGGIYSVMRSIA